MVSQSKTLAYSSDPMPTCDVQLLLDPVVTQARVNRAKTRSPPEVGEMERKSQGK